MADNQQPLEGRVESLERSVRRRKWLARAFFTLVLGSWGGLFGLWRSLDQAKAGIGIYVEQKKAELNSLVTTKEAELSSFVMTKKTDLDSFIKTRQTDLDLFVTAKKGELDAVFKTKNVDFDSFVSTKKRELETFVKEAKNLDRVERVEQRIKKIGLTYSGNCWWQDIGYRKSHGEAGSWLVEESEKGAFIVELDLDSIYPGAPEPDPANYPIIRRAKYCRP